MVTNHPWSTNAASYAAHGAAYHVAPDVLAELGARVYGIGVEPDGININRDCGSMHPARLQQEVLARRALPARSVFQLALTLPKLIRGVDTLYFGVESLWCNPAEDQDHFWIGFHVIDISPQDSEVLALFLESV